MRKKHFPADWAEGLRSPIYKSGPKLNCSNYRGITVLPVFEKVFEILILSRLEFISDAFDKKDRHNGGFTKGSRTSDNNFIIHGLVQRQLYLGKKLIVIHVDFSRAIDSVNRAVLFYKLKKSGYRGRVIDTLLDLYRKTSFRVKVNGKTSDIIQETIGVNQGSITSPFLFKEYLSDLKLYLDANTGVCMGKEILVHQLWADDLFMVSDYSINSQRQLDNLKAFCAPNQIIVNEVKTKFMVYGSSENIELYLDGNRLEQVNKYKSLGIIINSVKSKRECMFRCNTEYLSSKARMSAFGIRKRLKNLKNIPPSHWFHIYESMIEPILIYGSDLWGASVACTSNINKVYLWYIRIILNIKATTSNVITMGESGLIPPEIKCHENVILYFIRLKAMTSSSVVKNVFIELERLHTLGYDNWYSEVLRLAHNYDIDIENLKYCESTKKKVKGQMRNQFMNEWTNELHNLSKNSSLRTYSLFKNKFTFEPYLGLINKSKYLIAFTRFRTGSHTLEIERGRYNNPRTPIENRLCPICSVVEDEQHFMMDCKLYKEKRKTLFDKISSLFSTFSNIPRNDKFIFLMSNDDSQILSWTGRFIFESMHIRAAQHLTAC